MRPEPVKYWQTKFAFWLDIAVIGLLSVGSLLVGILDGPIS